MKKRFASIILAITLLFGRVKGSEIKISSDSIVSSMVENLESSIKTRELSQEELDISLQLIISQLIFEEESKSKLDFLINPPPKFPKYDMLLRPVKDKLVNQPKYYGLYRIILTGSGRIRIVKLYLFLL